MKISINLILFMSKKRDNDYAPRQQYISPNNLKDIYLPYKNSHKHTYVNVIGSIIYFNHVGKILTVKGNMWYMAIIIFSKRDFIRERKKPLPDAAPVLTPSILWLNCGY